MEKILSQEEKSALRELLERFPVLRGQQDQMEQVYYLLRDTFSGGGKLLVCGNGGSAADALHIVGELMKSFRFQRSISPEIAQNLSREFGEEGRLLARQLEGALPAVALVENAALSTAIGNDMQPGVSFAQQVLGLGRPGDMLLCISTSGNAKNVIAAARVAAAKGMAVAGLSGASGGELRHLCSSCICVGEKETYRIQELHLPVYHALCAMLEVHFFGKDLTG